MDPLSDAEALAAAQAAAQPQQSKGDSTSVQAADAQAAQAAKAADALGNEQMVWEMLYNPDYSLPTTDAVAAWHRAMGKEPEEEEVGDHALRIGRAQALATSCSMLPYLG